MAHKKTIVKLEKWICTFYRIDVRSVYVGYFFSSNLFWFWNLSISKQDFSFIFFVRADLEARCLPTNDIKLCIIYSAKEFSGICSKIHLDILTAQEGETERC